MQTLAAALVKKTTATLNGRVNPEGSQVADCHFEFGKSTMYGNTAACAPEPGGGSTPVAVSAQVKGLSSHTTYHVRLVATNAGGTSYGGDVTFATSP